MLSLPLRLSFTHVRLIIFSTEPAYSQVVCSQDLAESVMETWAERYGVARKGKVSPNSTQQKSEEVSDGADRSSLAAKSSAKEPSGAGEDWTAGTDMHKGCKGFLKASRLHRTALIMMLCACHLSACIDMQSQAATQSPSKCTRQHAQDQAMLKSACQRCHCLCCHMLGPVDEDGLQTRVVPHQHARAHLKPPVAVSKSPTLPISVKRMIMR